MNHRKLTSAFVAISIVTLSGQATALASQSSGSTPTTLATKSGPTGSSTTTTTLPKVPAAAEPLLKKLLGIAGQINTENQQSAGLSEQYDLATLHLASANAKVSRIATEVRVATKRLSVAKHNLQSAAIEAYVTGENSAVDASLLANNVGNGAMADVYASAATGHVSADIGQYRSALAAVRHSEEAAKANSAIIAESVASAKHAQSAAVALQWEAYASLNTIKSKLLGLVGAKEFNRLMSPEPEGSPYKGPNLAGVFPAPVATGLQPFAALAAAKKLLGVPYVWGGASDKGVDCSGLTMLAWGAAGIKLAHSATAQWEASKPVPLSEIQPGDLLFYHFAHDGNTPITHVVMYVGSGPYGATTIIQAAHTGTNVSYSPFFLSGLVSAGRP